LPYSDPYIVGGRQVVEIFYIVGETAILSKTAFLFIEIIVKYKYSLSLLMLVNIVWYEG